METRLQPSRISPLLTDLYQLTMASGYWQHGLAEQQAVFQLTFRECPFGGQYAIAAGLADVIDYLNAYRFTEADLIYLGSLSGADGKPLFQAEFLAYLQSIRFSCDLDAIPEGRAVFPHEPLIRVQGPLLQAQLIETMLLNTVNFQTLIATKSARIRTAAGDDAVLEFGLRRAQGFDGGLSASRAAFIGGSSATSNVLAGRTFGIPVKGTHAHSWVMTFDSELASFRAYADALPNNVVFLVDTYDTLEGVRRAIQVALEMRKAGHQAVGIRLDSGDLGALSREARKLLDAAGFPDVAIVASNDLDEYRIQRLKQNGAQINIWGVGTRLATAYDQPALGGVYKLSAIRENESHPWRRKIKLSDDPIKVSNPGLLQIRRWRSEDGYVADMMYDSSIKSVDSAEFQQRFVALQPASGRELTSEDLLAPVFRQGKLVYQSPSLESIREQTLSELDRLPAATRRIQDAAPYHVGLERQLQELKTNLITQAERVSP